MEEVDVRKCFVDHFKGMYQCKPNRTNVSRLLASLGCVDKSLSTQHFQFLTRPFIGTKLIAAMFQIGAWKAPGPNKIFAAVYQQYMLVRS